LRLSPLPPSDEGGGKNQRFLSEGEKNPNTKQLIKRKKASAESNPQRLSDL